MGALTLKPFSDESREWELVENTGIDITDGFGATLSLSFRENKIFLSEPCDTELPWITDRARLFFEGAFVNPELEAGDLTNWKNVFNQIKVNTYFLDHFKFQFLESKNYNFTFIFKRLSLELLQVLNLLETRFSFINLRSLTALTADNDQESFYQMHPGLSLKKLQVSSLVILLGANTRYESYRLNLSLRQRYLKGNFNLLNIGPNLDLTIPSTTIGSTTATLLSICEGRNFYCQQLNQASFPLFIVNSTYLKHFSFKKLSSMLLPLQRNCNLLSSIEVMSDKIEVTGMNASNLYNPFSKTDIEASSFLYFLNTDSELDSGFKKNLEITALHSSNANLCTTNTIVNQAEQNSSSYLLKNLKSLISGKISYLHLPSKTVFEENSTYLNTQGLIKKNIKLVNSKSGSKSNWQILKYLYSSLQTLSYTANQKNSKILSYDGLTQKQHSNYYMLNYLATRTLTSISFLANSNSPSCLFSRLNLNESANFKLLPLKFISVKVKYVMDDFFVGGNKDNYSPKSLTLTKCSKAVRLSTTNFF